MEIMSGVMGVLILIIIGMLFGRILQTVGLFFEVITKFIRKLF